MIPFTWKLGIPLLRYLANVSDRIWRFGWIRRRESGPLHRSIRFGLNQKDLLRFFTVMKVTKSVTFVTFVYISRLYSRHHNMTGRVNEEALFVQCFESIELFKHLLLHGEPAFLGPNQDAKSKQVDDEFVSHPARFGTFGMNLWSQNSEPCRI
jgi:hypothetical protein